jgi:hypothetical protein
VDAVHFTRRQIPDCWNLHQHHHWNLKSRALYRSITDAKTIRVHKLRSNYQCARSYREFCTLKLVFLNDVKSKYIEADNFLFVSAIRDLVFLDVFLQLDKKLQDV